MRRPWGWHRTRRACWGALVCAGVALTVACGQSASSSSAPATTAARAKTAAPGSRPASPAITVSGRNPVTPNGSQDTSAATPGVACDQSMLAADERAGEDTAAAFAFAGFPAAASLLTHFLQGTGTAVDFRAGSALSQQARASSPFQAVNQLVQAEILGQLKAGAKQVRLTAAQLPAVAFETPNSDLYWGFRGTQGMTVRGRLTRAAGRYAGTLQYVIRDSYGFPADDTLAGFGPPMRYLQTTCGAPQHPGGARWFPDTITVTVPFSKAA